MTVGDVVDAGGKALSWSWDKVTDAWDWGKSTFEDGVAFGARHMMPLLIFAVVGQHFYQSLLPDAAGPTTLVPPKRKPWSAAIHRRYS